MGYESRSFCTCGTSLVGLFHGLESPVGVTLAGGGGSLDGIGG